MKLSFEEWKREVDRFILAQVGMTSDDLPDWGYRDAYEGKTSPGIAAKRAVRAARDF